MRKKLLYLIVASAMLCASLTTPVLALLSDCHCNSEGSYDFDCTQRDLVIGNEVTNVWGNAFEDCTNIASIKIPDPQKSVFHGIGSEAFANSTLSSIMFPANIYLSISDIYNPEKQGRLKLDLLIKVKPFLKN